MSTFTLYSQADRFPEENSADYPTFVTPDDRQTLLRHWNNTQRSFDHVCVQRLIERQVQRTPDAEAVRCGDKSVSYRELDRRANRLAHFLGRLGVVHETLVGVWLERSIDAIVAFLAVWKAGGACVPFDTESPRERLVMMLDDCRPLALITRNGIDAGILASSPCKVVQLERDADVIACESEENPLVVATLSDLAVVFYTSGTTGRPKGVMQVHRGIANWVVWQQRNFPLGSGDGELQTAPISFGLSVGQIFQALTAGARVVIIPPGVPLYGQTIVDTIRRYSCTKWVPVPSLLRIALAAGLTSCASLRYVLSTGSPLPVQLKEDVCLTGSIELYNGWGATECFLASAFPCRSFEESGGFVPVGAPIDNMQLYIVDEQLEPVPIGTTGELCVGGANLARGYLGYPELTAAKFVSHPFSDEPGARIYRTGDLARWRQDGSIEFIGRSDHLVKVRGNRVELSEIEVALNRHPDIIEAIVVDRVDRHGETILVAYLVARKNSAPTTRALRLFLLKLLPAVMVPSFYVMLESMPLTSNKKIDRAALPAPEGVRPNLEQPFHSARNALEQKLVELWTEFLVIDQVGIHDNFFDLGGDSLGAAELVFRMASACGVELAFTAALDDFTVAHCSKLVETARLGRISGQSGGRYPDELLSDAMLGTEIRFDASQRNVKTTGSVFLTGATGFLGRQLAIELATRMADVEVFCLVRADDQEHADARLHAALKKSGFWDGRDVQRFIAIPGDLSLPHFGLSRDVFVDLAESVDFIVHAGASVNLIQPYSVLKASNVAGTREVLRFAATGHVKPVFHVSTVAVGVEYEAGDPMHNRRLTTGYAQSKWVAEALVREAGARGIPVSIFRLTEVIWHSKTGLMNESDALHRLLATCLQLACIPPATDMERLLPSQWTTVDYASAAIVELAVHAPPATYHIVSPHNERWDEVHAAIVEVARDTGQTMDIVSYARWMERLRMQGESTPLGPLARLFLEAEDGRPRFDGNLYFHAEAANRELSVSDLQCPRFDKSLVRRYFDASFLKNSSTLTV